jgi:hypothetical protein
MKKTGSIIKNPDALQPSPELISIQAYMPINPDDLERLRKDIQESGEVRDPIKAYEDREGELFILGGYNRWQIAKEFKITVPVDTYSGTAAEYRELIVKDNLNRRHFTAEQKRELIKYLLKEDPGQSSRAIAKQTGTHHSTVEEIRKNSGGEISHLRKGQDGKEYSVKKPPVKPSHASQEPLSKAKKQDEGEYISFHVKRYNRLLNVIEKYINANQRAKGIKDLKEQIELIKNMSK